MIAGAAGETGSLSPVSKEIALSTLAASPLGASKDSPKRRRTADSGCVRAQGIRYDMKATIERATLLKCLSHVQSVVERRNTIPILSNVLIEAAADGTLKIMATDLDLQVVESLSAVSVEVAGAITVSAHLLFDIARKLPDGSQVSLETADNRMAVKAGRSRFSLPTLPRDDFPMIVEGDLPTSFELGAALLAQMIDRTKFAISTEETRNYLTGIFLHVTDDE